MSNPDDKATQINETISYHDNRDPFLIDVVRLANLGLGIGVTVIVEGAMISGTMIGGKRYFEALGEAVSKGNASGFSDGSNLLQGLGDSFKSRSAIYDRPHDADDDWSQPEPGYIHLEDARLYAPGGEPIPNQSGLLFRAKLNAVSGFTIGNLS